MQSVPFKGRFFIIDILWDPIIIVYSMKNIFKIVVSESTQLYASVALLASMVFYNCITALLGSATDSVFSISIDLAVSAVYLTIGFAGVIIGISKDKRASDITEQSKKLAEKELTSAS